MRRFTAASAITHTTRFRRVFSWEDMSPIIRQATRADVASYAPDKCAPTFRGLVMELNGEIIGIAGIALINGRHKAFCDLKPEARQYKFRIARAARRFFAELRRDNIRFIYADRDVSEPRSLEWLTSLGFELDPRSLTLYRWTA
jgi:hypothetical protein